MSVVLTVYESGLLMILHTDAQSIIDTMPTYLWYDHFSCKRKLCKKTPSYFLSSLIHTYLRYVAEEIGSITLEIGTVYTKYYSQYIQILTAYRLVVLWQCQRQY